MTDLKITEATVQLVVNEQEPVFLQVLRGPIVVAGGGGVTVHNDLTGRSDPDAHPISSITGLSAALAAAGNVDSVNGQTGTVVLDLDDLTDVDTTTDPPDADDVLAWDGVMWTPAALTAADTGAIPASLIDAKGDLIVGTANDTAARLGVGSDGQVLTADSAEAGGVKWAAAAGGGAVDSVNGQTGVVVLDASDVGAAATSHSHAGSDITSGTVAFDRLPTGTSSTQVAAGDHTHTAADVGAVATSALDTDGTLAANSDTRVATQKATKTYVDAHTATIDEAQVALLAQVFGG